jgi:hypothetical protein
MTDAAHIAITTVNGLDFIVSLNFEHIVRPWTFFGKLGITPRYVNFSGQGRLVSKSVEAVL